MGKSKKKEAGKLHRCACSTCQKHSHGAIAREHRALNRLVAAANERDRRLLLGFLAQQEGHGGVTLLARVTGLNRNTIARGRREILQEHPLPRGCLRRRGAGRRRVEDKHPGS